MRAVATEAPTVTIAFEAWMFQSRTVSARATVAGITIAVRQHTTVVLQRRVVMHPPIESGTSTIAAGRLGSPDRVRMNS